MSKVSGLTKALTQLSVKEAVPTEKIKEVSASNSTEECFSIVLGIGPPVTPEGASWEYQIPVLQANEKRLILEIKSATTVLVEFNEDFPMVINLKLSNYSGYSNDQGDPSTFIATLVPSTVTAQVSGQISSYNVVYKLAEPIAWNIGLMRDLVLFVSDYEGNVISPPLVNSISLQMKIHHLSI